MEIIEVNDKSAITIYHDKERKVWYRHYEDYGKQSWRQRELGDAAVPRHNIIFSAHIVPIDHTTHRSSGSVIFKDTTDGTIFRMTQKSMYGLLNGILTGSVTIGRGGFSALFTFRSLGDDLSIDVFEGH